MRPTHSFVWFSLISAACAATPAAAQPSAACTLSGTSHADTVLNPAIGEDDAFLGSRSRGLPTVAFVLDTSDHMRRFPYDLTSQGVRSQGLKCANTLLNDLVYESNPCVDGKGQAVSPAPAGCDSVTHKPAGWGLGYQRTASGASVLRTYPAYDRDIPGLFSSTRYYVHDLGWGVNSTNVANANVYTTAALACAAGASGEEGECTSCVVSSGYYLPTSATARPVLAGNWINFYPPKYVVARKVLKDQFAALDFPSRNRMTMLTMSDTDRARCYSQRLDGTGMDANRDGARLIGNPTRFKPPCNQFAACMHNGSSGGGRSAFDNQVNGQNTLFTGPPTPCPNGVALPSSAPPGAQSVAMVPGSDGVCRGEYRDNSSARLGDAICAPYAESLLNAGQYLGDERLYDSLFPSSPAGHWRKPDFDLADGVCGASSCGCPRPVVIMIAGGSPDFDDNLPCEITGVGCSSTLVGAPACGDAGAAGNLPRVAKFLSQKDIKPSTRYNSSPVGVSTYIIGFGTRAPSLMAAADAGNGQFFSAESATSLRSAINDALRAVSSAQLSFSNANVTTVQTRTSSALLVPRFTPSRKALWKGHLYQYQLVNEDACGCKATTAPEPFDACDFNQDRACGGVFFKDADDAWIAADAQGVFRKASPQTPVGGVFRAGTAEARPRWDAAEALQRRSSATGVRTGRRIYTVVDSSGDGLFDHRDDVVPFDETRVATLLPYMNIGPGDFCGSLSNRLQTCLSPTECARKVVQYVRGMDIFDEDCDGNRLDDRPFKLGDIYHSSPVVVEAPLPSRSLLCGLGISNQCLTSLFKTVTPMEGAGYGGFADQYKHRQKVVLVGANDGMVHAFHGGAWVGGDNPRTPTVNECPSPPGVCTGYYDDGTGDELWAFIPPDLLPKLQRMLEGKHEYYVDATPMVRDIWHDADRNGKKAAAEFHTVAVIGERRGGNHFFALDLTRPEGPPADGGPGFFRWTYPQPNTPQARIAGESYAEFLPGPPPIGPVRVKVDEGGVGTHQGVPFEERWVALLSGGYDQAHLRGRTVNMVDVWLGGAGASAPAQPLWAFDAGREGSSFAATPAMVGFGQDSKNAGGDNNGFFFDTATVGDVGGQLWALRFNHPDTTRWAGGRALRAQGTGGACARQPFYQVTANSVTAPGYLRSVVGTGDRFNLADIRGGECSATNLLGCVRRGCTLVTEVRRNICGRSSTYRREFTNANTATSCTDSLNTVTLDPLTNSNCCSQRTEAQLSYELRCTNSDASPVVLRWEPRIDCGTAGLNACGSSASGYVCNVSNDTPFDICSTFDRCDSPIAPPLSAFYSVKVFDDANPSRAIFNDAGGAATYDRNALLQSDLVQANPYDATAPPVTTATANGWYARFGQPSPPGHVYPQTPQSFDGEALNERTVTQASLIGGCAFWSTLTPNNTTNMCSTSRLSVHTQYRMNFLDGGPCRNLDPSLAATRYVQNQDTLPPAPPQLSVAVSPEGQVSLNLLSVSRTSGSSASNTPISASSGLAKDVYRLDVTRQTHACRHPEGATAAEKRAFAEANCSLK